MLKQRFNYYKHKLWHAWQYVRRVSGDDAYERYLAHHAAFHANSLEVKPALSRQEFFKLWQSNQWDGIKRCC